MSAAIGGVMWSNMICEFLIKDNTFINIYIFGYGSDLFYITLNLPMNISNLLINLDTNIIENLITETLTIENKIDKIFSSQS